MLWNIVLQSHANKAYLNLKIWIWERERQGEREEREREREREREEREREEERERGERERARDRGEEREKERGEREKERERWEGRERESERAWERARARARVVLCVCVCVCVWGGGGGGGGVVLRWVMCTTGEHAFFSSTHFCWIREWNAAYTEMVDYLHHKHPADILQDDRNGQKWSASEDRTDRVRALLLLLKRNTSSDEHRVWLRCSLYVGQISITRHSCMFISVLVCIVNLFL